MRCLEFKLGTGTTVLIAETFASQSTFVTSEVDWEPTCGINKAELGPECDPHVSLTASSLASSSLTLAHKKCEWSNWLAQGRARR